MLLKWSHPFKWQDNHMASGKQFWIRTLVTIIITSTFLAMNSKFQAFLFGNSITKCVYISLKSSGLFKTESLGK